MQNEQLFYTFILAVIAMIFGYSFHWSQRTLKLEKKNGHEQDQINELKKKIEELEAKDLQSDRLIRKLATENDYLKKELQDLKAQLKRYQTKHKQIDY